MPHRIFRMTLFALFTVVLMGSLAPVAQAQQSRTITFEEAVQTALSQNNALKRSSHAVALQAATVSSRRANFWPNLNFSSNTSRSYGLGFDQTTGRTFTEASDRFSMGVSSGVNLFNGFADVASVEEARLDLEANNLDFTRQQQTVVFNVMSQYLALIQNREQVLIMEENLAAQQQLLTQIEEFTRVGSRPMSDLFQQQAATATAELNLINAQRSVQLNEASLIQTLQLDPFISYTFEAPAVEGGDLVPEAFDVNTLLRNAYEHRVDLQAQESSIEARMQSLRVARSDYYPSLSLSGNVGSGYSSQLKGISFGTQLSDNRSETISLSLQVPIINGRTVKTAIERAQVQYETARLDLEDLQQNIASQVRQTYLDYLTDRKRLEVTEKQLQAAQQALDAEQERYNVGASTLVELSQARASFVRASSDRSEATYSFLFRKKLIEYHIGILDPTRPLFR